MRPQSVEEFVGQQHLLGPGRLLRDLLAGGRLESLILWGPPGTGKTTLARLLGAAGGTRTVGFSAVLHGVKELRQIVDLQVKRLARRLEEKKLGLQVEGEALDWLAGVGYDPVYGARPLKRAIQRELETPIAKAILAGSFVAGSTIAVAVENERLAFHSAAASTISGPVPALV
jgi:ATP-dependent Clp protease ATP-binding subunit ClpA